MAERISNNDGQQRVIKIIQQETDPSHLHERFDMYVNTGLRCGNQTVTRSGITFSRLGCKISKDRIQQEMYPMSYRRVAKREELEHLTSKYFVNKCDVKDFIESGGRFFVQVFPKAGEDNLVAICSNNKYDLIHFREYASREYVGNKIAADKIERAIRPVLNKINFDDEKGGRNLGEASWIRSIATRPVA